MSQKFKKGDKVRAVRNTHSDHERHPVGTEFVVGQASHASSLKAGEFVAGPLGYSSRYILPEADFELVLRWSDVEAGDTVTFRHERFGKVYTAEAYESPNEAEGLKVLGWRTNPPRSAGPGLTLLSIEKPKPQPPTTPGSHVLARPEEAGGVHLFLMYSGVWVNIHKHPWSLESIVEQGFEVIHDAGK